MSHYEKACKHHSSHNKDKYYQQCSGYFRKSINELSEEEKDKDRKYYIVNSDDHVVAASETYDGIISEGKDVKDKESHFIVSGENGIMGRLHFYYKTA